MQLRQFQPAAKINAARGFLPLHDPVLELAESFPLATHINDLVKKLPQLLQEKKLRIAIDELDKAFPDEVLASTQRGCSKAEKNVSLLFLKSLVQAYIWEEPSSPASTIPAVLTRNLYPLCKARQCYPIITYSDYVLNNWRLIDKDRPLSLENIEPIVTFTGTADEAWFIKIHVVIEAICASALHAATLIRQQVQSNDNEALVSSLLDIKTAIQTAIDIMHKMIEGCDPDVFWNTLRPYLSGWEKVKSPTEEVGVRFLGLATRDKLPSVYSGPSGAQSGILPALDCALNIKHEVDSMLVKLREFKEYMPEEHKGFVSSLQGSKIHKYAERCDSSQVKAAYEITVDSIKKFRGAHLGLVHQYIYKPAQEQGIDREKIVGTGGAPIDSYLSGRYQNTTSNITTLRRV